MPEIEAEPESPIPPTPPREATPEPKIMEDSPTKEGSEEPVPGKSPPEESSREDSSGKRRVRRRKQVNKTYMDKDGFMGMLHESLLDTNTLQVSVIGVNTSSAL